MRAVQRLGRLAALGRLLAPVTRPLSAGVLASDMVSGDEEFLFGEPVVSRRQLDPLEDHVGLYLWGTIVWHLLIVFGTAVLIVGGQVLL